MIMDNYKSKYLHNYFDDIKLFFLSPAFGFFLYRIEMEFSSLINHPFPMAVFSVPVALG